jgi:hypothetical protein
MLSRPSITQLTPHNPFSNFKINNIHNLPMYWHDLIERKKEQKITIKETKIKLIKKTR